MHVGRPNMGDQVAFQEHVSRIFAEQRLTNNGPLVQELERRIATYLGVRECVAMCNGTLAMEIAVRALDLDGEVIVPSYTFIATAHSLSWQAITPVFADIDPATHNLDPQSVRSIITPRTTGIIGVHLWGRAAPVEELQQVADDHGLALMFDAAHAFGCSHRAAMIGGFGAAEVLSFHATKVFNTFEGGAVVTNDKRLADKMRLMRNFGFAGFDNVIHPGTNAKMTEICAAMGLVNLDAFDRFVEANRRNYHLYREYLSGVRGVALLPYDENEKNNFNYIVMIVSQECAVSRDEIVRALHAENVLARRYFWPGCHKMKPYRDLYPWAARFLPHTEAIASRVVVMPTGSAVAEIEIKVLTDVIRVVATG
jgi:dTDP-4-amino-4,6-dideoxygalactose transaminase